MNPSDNDEAFAELAVKAHYISRNELPEALSEYRRRLGRGERVPIHRVFLDLGMLLAVHVEELQRKQRRRVLFCEGCGAKLNVFGIPTGTRIRCPHCGRRVLVPIPCGGTRPVTRVIPSARLAWVCDTTKIEMPRI